MTMTDPHPYAVRLRIDYPETLDRVSTAFRFILVIPIAILMGALNGAAGTEVYNSEGTQFIVQFGGTVLGALATSTALMIVFRQRYPRWWFDFATELTRFVARVGAYSWLLTDQYPSTVDEQSVHIEFDYPDAERDLNRWMPLVKWLLAIPHYFVLGFLAIGAFFAVIIAWFAIIITGRFPQGLFDYIVGVGRWSLRVEAYTTLLITDEYPPFSLH